MKKYHAAILCLVAGAATANPVVNLSPNTKGSISHTVIETWNLSETEKKSEAMMMSQFSAEAIAPTVRIKRGEWTALNSQHKSCFYNTFGTMVEGRYLLKFNIAGKEVSTFEKIPVGAGQAYCVTRYLQIWVRGDRPGDTIAIASTHVEMDGQSTENEGHGTITVR